MNKNIENAVGIINCFVGDLVSCGFGKWSYELNKKLVDMSGCYMGLLSDDFKVNLIHNRNGRSELTILDFSGGAEILEIKDRFMEIKTMAGIMRLCAEL